MNFTPVHVPRAAALSLALITATVAGPQAQAIDPGTIAQLGQIYTMVVEWKGRLDAILAIKDQIFNKSSLGDFAQNMKGKLTELGLNKLGDLVGVDILGLINNVKGFQGKVDDVKNRIVGQFNDRITSFLDPKNFDRTNKLWERAIMNPDTFAMKFDGLIKQQAEAINKTRNIQDVADSVAALTDSKAGLEAAAKSSLSTGTKATEFAAKAAGIQSTREGVALLVQAQAAALAGDAYNATSVTAAISQSVRQQQVTNNQLSDLVNDRIEERTGEVLGAMHAMRLSEASAIAQGRQVNDTISWAAQGFSAAIQGGETIDSKDLF